MNLIPWLDSHDPRQAFPAPERALDEPNGLLAVGGCLSPQRLLLAYSQGTFPWYAEGDPICWWNPNPRTVLFPDRVRISRSLRKVLKKNPFRVSLDRDFGAVIDGCAAPRGESEGTWITPAMRAAYLRLFELGFAHSVEVWRGDSLVGGLYGVALGKVFFGESMFSRLSNTSKIALVYLCAHLREWGFGLIDCQLPTAHLQSMGAIEVPRDEFLALLHRYCVAAGQLGHWQFQEVLSDRHTDSVAKHE